MPHWETDGASIYYETWETGAADLPWVTLVNGHTRTLRDFRAMGNYLSGRFRVLAFDNRGSGRTVTSRAFTMEDLASDVLGLWRQLGCTRSHLLGISMGGMIAMTVAVRRPPELSSLELVSTVPKWERDHEADSCAGKSREAIERDMFRYFSPAFAERQKLLIQALVKDLSKAFDDPLVKAGTEAQRSALQGFDIRAKLSLIQVPTLVLHGGEDRVASVDGARTLAAAIPGARLEILPGVGHLLLAEAAQKFYSISLSFFTEVEGARKEERHGGKS